MPRPTSTGVDAKQRPLRSCGGVAPSRYSWSGETGQLDNVLWRNLGKALVRAVYTWLVNGVVGDEVLPDCVGMVVRQVS
jgi:hypothetical protein